MLCRQWCGETVLPNRSVLALSTKVTMSLICLWGWISGGRLWNWDSRRTAEKNIWRKGGYTEKEATTPEFTPAQRPAQPTDGQCLASSQRESTVYQLGHRRLQGRPSQCGNIVLRARKAGKLRRISTKKQNRGRTQKQSVNVFWVRRQRGEGGRHRGGWLLSDFQLRKTIAAGALAVNDRK